MVFFKKAYGGGSHVPLGVLPLYLYLFSWLLQLKSAPFSLRNPVAGERRCVTGEFIVKEAPRLNKK